MFILVFFIIIWFFRETTTKSVTKSTITTTIKQTVWTKRPELGITNSKTNVENEESSDSSHVVRGVVIGLSLVALVTLGIVGLFWYQRMQRRRYCSQEFLLGTFINYVLKAKNQGTLYKHYDSWKNSVCHWSVKDKNRFIFKYFIRVFYFPAICFKLKMAHQ